MSEAAAKSFIEKVKSDAELQKLLKGVDTSSKGAALEAAVKIAETNGFELNAHELEDALGGLSDKQVAESDNGGTKVY